MVADRACVAVGDQPAARHHDDAVGEGEHHVHRVLGEEHRDASLDHEPLDQRNQLAALARRHAGGRLVHQQEAGLIGERDRQFHPLDVAIGKLARGAFGGLAHADLLEQRERAVAMVRRRRPHEAVGFAGMRDERHLHVLDHGHGAEGSGDLERAADAEPEDRARRQPGDVAAVEARSRPRRARAAR